MPRPASILAPSPTLQPIGHDLTDLARQNRFVPLIGHDVEVERILEVLISTDKNNPVLLGDVPAARFAVVAEVVRRMATSIAHNLLSTQHVWMLDIEMLAAGALDHATLERRLREVFWQINRYHSLLYIDPLNDFIGIGGGVPFVDANGAQRRYDASTLLKPLFGRKQIQIMGATTLDRYRRHIECDATMQRRFREIMMRGAHVD